MKSPLRFFLLLLMICTLFAPRSMGHEGDEQNCSELQKQLETVTAERNSLQEQVDELTSSEAMVEKYNTFVDTKTQYLSAPCSTPSPAPTSFTLMSNWK